MPNGKGETTNKELLEQRLLELKREKEGYEKLMEELKTRGEMVKHRSFAKSKKGVLDQIDKIEKQLRALSETSEKKFKAEVGKAPETFGNKAKTALKTAGSWFDKKLSGSSAPIVTISWLVIKVVALAAIKGAHMVADKIAEKRAKKEAEKGPKASQSNLAPAPDTTSTPEAPSTRSGRP